MSNKKYPLYKIDVENNPYDDSKVLKKDIINLADGRPVLCELWKEYEYTFLSYYFSALNIEDCSKEQIIDYLEKNGIKNLSNSKNFTLNDISIEQRERNDDKFWVMTISVEDI